MNTRNIKIGETYKHTSGYWAKAIEILLPRQHPNENNYAVVKCHFSSSKNSDFGMVKYFKADDLTKIDAT